MSNEHPIRGEGSPIVASVSLGAAEGKVGTRPKDPPTPTDWFGKLLKVGTLGVLIERLVNGALEVVEKLHGLWKRYRSPAADLNRTAHTFQGR